MYFRNNNFKNKLLTFFTTFGLPLLIFIFGIFLIIISNVDTNKNEYYLNLIGDENISLYIGNEYIEPGYNAKDSNNNDLTKEVIVDNNINTEVSGNYQITYTLNNIIKVRNITILDKPKGVTEISLKGDENIYLKIGQEYVEPGYIATDSVDGYLNDKIKITNNIDNTKKGTYQVKYSVVNSSGVTTFKVRNVIVVDSNISLTLDKIIYTNKDVYINVYVDDEYFDYILLPDNTKIYDKNYSYKVTENGTYNFVVYNKLGNVKSKSIDVININKTSPSGSCSGYYIEGVSVININAYDDIGLSKYVINGYSYIPEKQIVLEGQYNKVTFSVYDKAFNSKTISCKLEDKNYIPPKEEVTPPKEEVTPPKEEVTPPKEEVTPPKEEKNKSLEIHFIAGGSVYDDAILIRTNEKTIMIDGGRWSCHNYVTSYLKTLGVTKIDAMIGSHLHYNHIQAQGDILDNFTVDKIYYPDDIFACSSTKRCDSIDQQYIVSALIKHSKTPIILKPGQKVTIGDIQIYILAPQTLVTGTYCQNANSFIFILKYYDNTFMFTGDVGASQLNGSKLKPYADSLGISLDVDVLKYPHHGNAALYDNSLSYIKPEYVIVPNNNKSSYPTSTNINMIKSYGALMYRQSDSSTGNIVLLSDGSKITVKTGISASQYKR